MSKNLPVVLFVEKDPQYLPMLQMALGKNVRVLRGRNFDEAFSHLAVGTGNLARLDDGLREIAILVLPGNVPCATHGRPEWRSLTYVAELARSLGFTGPIICTSGDWEIRRQAEAAGCELVDSHRVFHDLTQLADAIRRHLIQPATPQA